MKKNKMIFAASEPIKLSDEDCAAFMRRLCKVRVPKQYNVLVFYDGPRMNEFKEFETYTEAKNFAKSTGRYCLINMVVDEIKGE